MPFRLRAKFRNRPSACLMVAALCITVGAAVIPRAAAQEAPQQVPEEDAPPQPQQPPEQEPQQAPPQTAPAPAQTPDPFQKADSSQGPPPGAKIIAIVPLDKKIPGYANEVTGAMHVFNGRAFIAADASITSGNLTTQVTLPYRGTLRICALTTIKVAADSTVPAGEIPGLMMAMDHGAVEASFATGRNSDFLLTPDFRILIGGPGAADVKVRLGPKGDTCVDNAGVNAPYVLVTSVLDGDDYHVQAGQRVMFQHGSLHEVVDAEKEPCGCPPDVRNSNDFPLAESEGLAPTLHPAPVPKGQLGQAPQTTETLQYNAAEKAPKTTQPAPVLPPIPAAAPAPEPPPASQNPPQIPPEPKKKRGFFHKIGGFFRKVFGAD